MLHELGQHFEMLHEFGQHFKMLHEIGQHFQNDAPSTMKTKMLHKLGSILKCCMNWCSILKCCMDWGCILKCCINGDSIFEMMHLLL